MTKYIVSAITLPFGEPVGDDLYTDNPEEAVKRWFELQAQYPTCVNIQASNNKTAKELLTWADTNSDRIDALWRDTEKFPYKLHWLKNAVKRMLAKDSPLQWEYDMLYPFCMG